MRFSPAIFAYAALLTQAAFAAGGPWHSFSNARHLPPPASQRAEIAVDGGVSRLAAPLDVARVRSPEPEGLTCGDMVSTDAPDGFAWFCTRHYAVKTDLDRDGAAHILELLELARPHYATTFGAVPPPGRRMALVAASNRNALKKAAAADSMFAFTLGGVMQEGYGCAYLYCGTPYQTRYIVLHEATHLFQYSISGDTRGAYGFFVEGVADYISSHVYDPVRHELAVNVLDRAPIHNHLANGLAEWREKGKPPFSALYADPEPSRGVSVLLTAFLQSTPEMQTRWRSYCKEAARRCADGADNAKAASDALIDSLYGGVAALDAPFAEWIEALSPSYELVSREFDQEGATFVSHHPASPAAPAILAMSAKATGVREAPQATGMRVQWREPPARGSFAKVVFGGAGDAVECVISNTSASLALFEVNGVRQRSSGAARLHSALRDGVEVRISGGAVVLVSNGETLASAPLPGGSVAPRGWTISASQPGIAFTPAGAPDESAQQDGARAKAGRAWRGQPPEAAPPLPRREIAVGDWLVLGPFSLPGGHFAHCGRPLLPFPVDAGAVHTLDDGTFAAWRRASIHCNGAFATAPIANLTETFGRQANNSFAYALARIDSPGERDATLVLGVSDGVEISVNGEEVLDDFRWREWRDGNVRAKIRLREGRNDILLRLSHAKGVWLLSGGLEAAE